MKLELDCRQVSRLISEGLDDKLPPAERARVRLHFVICDGCRNIAEQMDFLRRAMRQTNKDRGAEGD